MPKTSDLWISPITFKKIIDEKQAELGSSLGNKPTLHPDVTSITNPAITALLQIVDDSTFNGQRRNNILNPMFSYCGITVTYDKKKIGIFSVFA